MRDKIFEVAVKQWLPESCEWKEVRTGAFTSFDDADKEAARLRKPGVQAYVAVMECQ